MRGPDKKTGTMKKHTYAAPKPIMIKRIRGMRSMRSMAVVMAAFAGLILIRGC